MKLGLMLKDPEEEHDCFSDNTHNAHYYGALGLRNIWFGRYTRLDGEVMTGASLAALLTESDPDLARDIAEDFDAMIAAMTALKNRGDTIEHYDHMISGQSPKGEAAIEAAIDALIRLANGFERGSRAIGLSSSAFEGSDSLDSPQAVFE